MREVVLVVGEALVDVVRQQGSEQDHPGGSAANAAVALARLGHEVWMATGWADDAHGAILAGHLAANGVQLAGDPSVLARTSTATATIRGDGSAHYDFDIASVLGTPVLPSDASAVVVACGSIAAVVEPAASTVRREVERRRGEALCYLDVNARPAATGSGPEVVERLERLAAACHLVKASDEDLAALWPGASEDEAVDRLLGLGPGAVVVTRGSLGSSWCARDGRVDVETVPVEVADTIGAGDTLGAAVVHGLRQRGVAGPGAAERLARLTQEDRREVLVLASRAAAITVSRPGADPPWAAELNPGPGPSGPEAASGGPGR